MLYVDLIFQFEWHPAALRWQLIGRGSIQYKTNILPTSVLCLTLVATAATLSALRRPSLPPYHKLMLHMNTILP